MFTSPKSSSASHPLPAGLAHSPVETSQLALLTSRCCVAAFVCRLSKTSSRAANKIERLESSDSAAAPLCGVYNPPRPEDLSVNLEIKVREPHWLPFASRQRRCPDLMCSSKALNAARPALL